MHLQKLLPFLPHSFQINGALKILELEALSLFLSSSSHCKKEKGGEGVSEAPVGSPLAPSKVPHPPQQQVELSCSTRALPQGKARHQKGRKAADFRESFRHLGCRNTRPALRSTG